MQLFLTMIFSIAQAITVRMGHLLGEKNNFAAEQTAYLGVSLSGLFLFICSMAFLFFPLILISLDLNIHDPNNFPIIHYAKQFFLISAFFMILEGVRISLLDALRGLKDTRFTLLVSIITFWCIAFPVGYWLAKYFQGAGLWLGMVLGAASGVVMLFWRFKLKMKNFLMQV